MAALLNWLGQDTEELRAAAWIARCVGRGEAAPLRRDDVDALARYLQPRHLPAGSVLFAAAQPQTGVWMVRSGLVELSAGSGPRRPVVALLRQGDVDGDIQLLLDMAPPYTARAIEDVEVVYLEAAAFDRLLLEHPAIARRWLSSVAQRVSAAQERLLGLLGASLPQQAARLLLAEAESGTVALPQRVLAAMLGVQRSSLNKVLRDFEHDGMVELGYRTVTLRESGKLAKIAGSR